MANDGAIHSEFEEYLVTTIKAITGFAAFEVRAYGGVPMFGASSLSEVLEQIKGENVDPAILVNGTEVRPKRSGAGFEWDRTYVCEVLIANKNTREGGKAARMGEGASDFGTHKIVERITNAIHGSNPAASVDSGIATMHNILVESARALTMEQGYSVWQLTITGDAAFNNP